MASRRPQLPSSSFGSPGQILKTGISYSQNDILFTVGLQHPTSTTPFPSHGTLNPDIADFELTPLHESKVIVLDKTIQKELQNAGKQLQKMRAKHPANQQIQILQIALVVSRGLDGSVKHYQENEKFKINDPRSLTITSSNYSIPIRVVNENRTNRTGASDKICVLQSLWSELCLATRHFLYLYIDEGENGDIHKIWLCVASRHITTRRLSYTLGEKTPQGDLVWHYFPETALFALCELGEMSSYDTDFVTIELSPLARYSY